MNSRALRVIALVVMWSPLPALTLVPEWMAERPIGLRVLSLVAFGGFAWAGLEVLLGLEREHERHRLRPPQLAAPGLRVRLRRAQR